MLTQDGANIVKNGINLDFLKMTFLLIMLKVIDIFILLNGLMLISCMSQSMFKTITGLERCLPCTKDHMYDSLVDINSDARLQKSIKPLSKLLPHLLNSIAY